MKKYKLKDLLENKIAVRVENKEQLENICNKFNLKLYYFNTNKDLYRMYFSKSKLFNGEISWNEDNGYYEGQGLTVINYNQIDMEENKYTIEDLREGRIYIKWEKKYSDEIDKLFKEAFPTDNAPSRYNYSENNTIGKSKTTNGWAWFSPGESEANKAVSYSDFINKGEIIGYKAPFDMFNGKVKKDTIYMPFSYKNVTTYAATKDGKIIDSGDTNLPVEIVEQWQPIFREEIKEEEITIGLEGTKRTFTIGKNKIYTDGTNFTIEEVKALHDLYIPKKCGLIKSKAYDSILLGNIKIGCLILSEECLELIIKIYEKYN